MAIIDVVKDYDWTSVPKDSAMRMSSPSVWVKSFKVNSNQLIQAIKGFMNIKANIGTKGDTAQKFYDDLYKGSTTPEDDFRFPYFNDNIRSFNNSFSDSFQSGTGGAGGFGGEIFDAAKGVVGELATVANLADKKSSQAALDASLKGDFSGALNALGSGGAPGTYIETPMFYEYQKNDDAVQVSFVLSNTINTAGPSQNHELVKKLTFINRPLRLDSISMEPPRIYAVKIPGQRFIRWAYCSSFSVSLVGTRRDIGGIVTPEGYKIDMAFTSLTVEHAGFMNYI